MARRKKRSAGKPSPASSVTKSVRGKILAVLSQEKRVYNKKIGGYEYVPLTNRDAAKIIGVSTRTLRRWKNENIKPAKRSARAVTKLKKESSKVTRRISAQQAADRKKHPGAIKLTLSKLPALPRSHRRKLKRYKFDKKRGRSLATGEEYESNWANYDVRGWLFSEISALLIQVWQSGRPFQFIYEVPAGGSLPKSGGKPSRKVKKTTRASTAPINPGAFTDEGELLDFLNNYIDYEQSRKGRRLLFIAVDDQGTGRKRK